MLDDAVMDMGPDGARPTVFTSLSTLSCKSKKNAARNASAARLSPLLISPSRICIRDYTQDRHELNVQLQNVSGRIKYVSLMTLQSKFFDLAPGTNLNTMAIPPGFSKSIKIIFTPPGKVAAGQKASLSHVVCSDALQVSILGSQTQVLPIEAHPATSRIQFDQFIDYGNLISVQQGQTGWVARQLTIRNVGNRPAVVSINSENGAPIRLSHSRVTIEKFGAVDGASECKVTVEFNPIVTGAFHSTISLRVQLNSKNELDDISLDYKVDLYAKVQSHKLLLMRTIDFTESGRFNIEKLDFGTVYIDQEALIPIKLQNQSNEPVRWSISPANKAIPIIHDSESKNLRERRDIITLKKEEQTHMSVYPIEGCIAPLESSVVMFAYKPEHVKNFYGFKANSKPPEMKTSALDMTLSIMENTRAIAISSTDLPINLYLSGRACPLLASLHPAKIEFSGANSVYELQVRNQSQHGIIRFKFENSAHFHVKPITGRVVAGEACNVQVMFKPNQFGKFDMALLCHISSWHGEQECNLPKKVLKTLEAQMIAQWLPKRESAQHKSVSVVLPVLPSEYPPMADMEHSLQMSTEWKVKKRHHTKYIDYLRSSYNSRPSTVKAEEAVGELNPFAPLDGLNGLVPPELANIRPISIKNSPFTRSGSDQSKIVHATSVKHFQTEEQLQAEELEKILLSTSKINFGSISTHSQNMIELSFSNTIPGGKPVSICISLGQGNNDAKSLSINKSSCNISTGNTATFEVSCCHHSPGAFSSILTYTINNRYIFHIPVKAFVLFVPIKSSHEVVHFDMAKEQHADLSTNVIKKHFRNVEYEFPSSRKSFQLINNGSYVVSYEFVIHNGLLPQEGLLQFGGCDGAFQIYPSTGTIVANSKCEISAIFIPGTKVVTEQTVEVIVYDQFGSGKQVIQKMLIKLVGEGYDSQCSLNSFSNRTGIDLGIVPTAGNQIDGADLCSPNLTLISSNNTGKAPFQGKSLIRIKNSGADACPFVATLADSDTAFAIENHFGYVPANGNIDIQISAKPLADGVISNFVLINLIGGGKSFKVPVKCESQFAICEMRLGGKQFPETIVVDASLSANYYFKNSGCVYGRLVFEIEEDDGFKISSVHMIHEIVAVEATHMYASRNAKHVDTERKIDCTNERLGSCNGKAVIDLLPGETILVEICFKPTKVGKMVRNWNIGLQGNAAVEMKVDIDCEVIPAPVSLDRSLVQFQDVIIRPKSNAPHLRESIVLTNTSGEPAKWSFDECTNHSPPLSWEKFVIYPLDGTIAAGETQNIQITFVPGSCGKYEMSRVLRVNLAEKAYTFPLSLYGGAILPSISFEPPEIFLPIVPVGVSSYASFHIINNNCDMSEVNAIIPQELKCKGTILELTFPEGSMLRKNGDRIPCIAHFKVEAGSGNLQQKALSFNSRIWFFGSNSSVLVHGTAAACSLSLIPYYFLNQKLKICRNSEIARVQSAQASAEFHGKYPFTLPSGIQIKCSQDYQNTVEFYKSSGNSLITWLDDHVPKAAMQTQEFPNALLSSTGKNLLDLLQSISGGKKSSGVLYQPTESSEKLRLLFKCYEGVVLYISSIGGLLSSVKPEFLFSQREFLEFSNMEIEKLDSSRVTNASRISNLTAMQTYFEVLSLEAWFTTILQMVRTILMPTCKQKAIKAFDSGDGKDAVQLVSGTYGDSECFLLNWVFQNLSKELKAEYPRLNLETDFQDSVILAHLLASSAPFLADCFPGQHKLASQRDQNFENARNLIFSLQKLYGVNHITNIEPRQIIYANRLDLTLLLTFLYETLPSFSPKVVVEFQGLLHQDITKQIELVNGSNKSITYLVSIQGSADFAVNETEVTLAPMSQHQLHIEFKSHFLKQCSAVLTLKSRKMGCNVSSIICYSLVSKIESNGPSEVFEVKAPIYSSPVVNLPIAVHNPFNKDAVFQITIGKEQFDTDLGEVIVIYLHSDFI